MEFHPATMQVITCSRPLLLYSLDLTVSVCMCVHSSEGQAVFFCVAMIHPVTQVNAALQRNMRAHTHEHTHVHIHKNTALLRNLCVYVCVRVFVVCEWDCELWVMFLFSFMIARGRASDTVTAARRGEQRTEEKNGGKRGRTSQPHGVFIPTALSLSVAFWVKTKPWVCSQIE